MSLVGTVIFSFESAIYVRIMAGVYRCGRIPNSYTIPTYGGVGYSLGGIRAYNKNKNKNNIIILL
jgi:hypothetical protein